MTDLRIGEASARGRRVRFHVDGEPVEAYEGESVGAALWASGTRHLRSSPVLIAPRGMFCYMGVCQECVVFVDGRREPSCTLPVSEGLRVELLKS